MKRMTTSQREAMISFNDRQRIEWAAPWPRRSRWEGVVAWLPVLVLLGCVGIGLVQR